MFINRMNLYLRHILSMDKISHSASSKLIKQFVVGLLVS